MATPHIKAEKGDFAKTVLMPGDPLRAKLIADEFLEDAVLVNNVRGVQGYTGTYKGKKVSVMASGMGIPSIGIYSRELFEFFDVDNIIRIGTAGTLDENVELGEIVFGMAASTDSNFLYQFEFPGTYAPCCSYDLLRKAEKAADSLGLKYTAGNIFSSDVFYATDKINEGLKRMGITAIEMEAAGLYATAAYTGKNALCICTITDNLSTKASATPEERQNNLKSMITLALEMAE